MPTAARLVLVISLLCVACGGSSSETPPPLEPLPANMHYHRAATALPGETESQAESGNTKSAEAPAASGEPEIGPAPKTWGDGTKGLK
jgi:hypothetical protein